MKDREFSVSHTQLINKKKEKFPNKFMLRAEQYMPSDHQMCKAQLKSTRNRNCVTRARERKRERE